MTDRFSEDDARRIFVRAAERQHAVEARGEGLSLEELQAIGTEAGLDPEHVAAAVAELRSEPVAEPVLVSGADLTPRVVRVVPGMLSDDVWAAWVGRLRQTFGASGIPSEIGRVREWTSGEQSNLRVTAEPVDGGTRVTLESSKVQEAYGLRSLVPISVGLAGLLSLLFAFGDFEPTVWVIPVLTVAISVAVYLGVVAAYRSWSRRRRAEFEALADQLDLLIRADAAESPRLGAGAEGAPRPRLDLDALPDSGESSGRASHRDRARS